MIKTVPELQAAARALTDQAEALSAPLAMLIDQATEARTRIAHATLDSNMAIVAADQQRVILLDRQIARGKQAAQAAQQRAQDARAACHTAETELATFQRRLTDLREHTAPWTYHIKLGEWESLMEMTREQIAALTGEALDPLRVDAALLEAVE